MSKKKFDDQAFFDELETVFYTDSIIFERLLLYEYGEKREYDYKATKYGTCGEPVAEMSLDLEKGKNGITAVYTIDGKIVQDDGHDMLNAFGFELYAGTHGRLYVRRSPMIGFNTDEIIDWVYDDMRKTLDASPYWAKKVDNAETKK